MIRFVYPNVNASEQFVGCGRYITTSPDDPCLTTDYTIATPNVGHLSKVTTAASLLAKESFDSDQDVYEHKDDPTIPYLGDSMGLAYLLALIHRSRRTLWEQSGESLDIWCTGAIDAVGGMPMLHNVYRNLFAVKLQAFLADAKASLFIVPVANLEPKYRQLCRQKDVRVLSLDQCSKASIQEMVRRKTILQVHGDELAVLVKVIFIPPSIPSPDLSHQGRWISSPQPTFDVFLSYAPQDKTFVRHLAEYFRHEGLKVWLDDEQIDIGDQMIKKIEQGLQNSQFLVVCLSRYFNNSPWCRSECLPRLIRETNVQNTKVLPVIVGDYEEAAIPAFLYDKYYIDIRANQGLERLMRKIKPGTDRAISQNKPGSGHYELPEELQAGLSELQSKLLLFSKKAVVNDEVVVEFDQIGLQLLHLLEDFPRYFDEFHELIAEYQHFAENMFNVITAQEYRRLFAFRFRELEQCIEDLAGGFNYGESFLAKTLSGSFTDSPYAFYRVDFDELEIEHGVKRLMSSDEIEESEGIDWLLKAGFTEAETRLQRISDLDKLNQVFNVLWKRFPRILLYYHETFWELVKYMLVKDPLRWKLRFHALKILLQRSLTASQALEILKNFVPSEQQILSAFLVLHPKCECRKFAMEILPSDDRWDFLLCPAVPWLIIQELVEKSCQDSHDSYIKALFLLLRPRLSLVNSPLAIAKAYQIIKLFYYVPVFLQETFFQALINLHNQVNGKAQLFPITRDLEHEMRQAFQAFCAKDQLRDVDITEMTHIPLPIQRKLAHDGYLPKYFICNIRDIIALETVPYVERRPDVIKFFRLYRINARALEKLASNKLLMREYQNRAAFCYNPKANSVLIRTYLSTLTRRDLKDISRNHNVSAYARELAAKYLSRCK
ncbi:uncharacterized protein U27_06138 [Candidatus Vecturithrix granuli]|uniref:TIR domain-containing protein n=1 Tax=Vecturithrix granuli TaxID=1499967 RepID=A0A081C3K7_VECG1|nr:uncharacterized protein U27_06138 [Candidatus Vecturithrix granuli]